MEEFHRRDAEARKEADRGFSFRLGAYCLGMGLNHRGEEAVAGIAAGEAAESLDDLIGRYGGDDGFVLFGL